MRIVLTSNYKIGNETGASKVTDLLARKLSQKHTVLYICIGKKLEVINKSKNLKFLTLPSFLLRGIDIPLITPQALFVINKELDNFKTDVVHTQNHVLASRIVQFWASINKVPIIVTFHHIPTEPIGHMLPELSKNIFTKLAQDFYIQTTLKNYLSKCFAVISLNIKQFQEIKKINKDIKNVVINNGLEISRFIKIKKEKPKDIFNFVFLGSYTPRKNQMYLVKVFRNLPENFKLFLYGNFKSGQEYLSKLKKFIKTNQIKNVSINDFIKPEKIVRVYQKSHFFISASLKEVQSLAIIEALASGLPILGLKNETINDLVNSENGMVLSKNTTPKTFAKKIFNFVKNSNYENLSKRAKKTSLEFDINKTILKIENVYKSACDSNS